MASKIRHIAFALFRQKYLWTILAFIAIVGFLDTNSLWRLYELRRQNENLRTEISEYEKRYNADTRELLELQHSPEAVERVARVNLFMKTADEDIYVIE